MALNEARAARTAVHRAAYEAYLRETQESTPDTDAAAGSASDCKHCGARGHRAEDRS